MSGDDETKATYEPIVTLKEVVTDDGERDEDVIYKERAAAYRFDNDTKEWKERGKGFVRFMVHNKTKKIRLLLRQDKTLKIRVNHQVNPKIELTPNTGSDRSWTWATTDFSDDVKGKEEVLAIKFRDSDTANKFKAMYDTARKINAGEKIEVTKITDTDRKEEEEEEKKKKAEEEAAAAAAKEAEKEGAGDDGDS